MEKDIKEQGSVGAGKLNAEVVFFTGTNFTGKTAFVNYANIDFMNDPGYSFISQAASSLIVLKGHAQAFAPKEAEYYYANQGDNGQGCYHTLGTMDNLIYKNWLYEGENRPTSNPLLILRNGYNVTAADKVLEITKDTPSIDGFPAYSFIAIGSPTGEWYLYSGENYTGSVMKISVDGGSPDRRFGYYEQKSAFTVRSVAMALPTPDTGYWVSYPEFGVTTYALKNVNYPISKITVRFVSDSARELAFAPGALVEFAFNSTDHSLYYDGKRVDYIDMNNGGSDQDFAIPTSSSSQFIFYARKSGDNYNVLDFENSLFLSDLTFSEGISGNQSVTFKQSLNSGAATINLQVTTS
ncbi:hypothetical protein ACQVA2_22290 (plasmid) [Citrobacter sp. OP27]